jgi:hypothetical protein
LAWTNSNWRTAGASGSSARLAAMYALEKEMVDSLQNGKYKLGDHEHDPQVIQKELEALRELIAGEEQASAAEAGSTVFITRGRARRR